MLVDSNILIYATKPEYSKLRQWLIDTLPKASVISKVEILGYHKLHAAEKTALTELLNSLELIFLTRLLRNCHPVTPATQTHAWRCPHRRHLP